jgi:tripartite-type tricarboxylate transporter receptor subunit TctC
MKLPRRRFLYLAAGAAALPGVSRVARAQAYPARPITIVYPYAAGGPGDVIARIIAEPMRAILGKPIIIENVGGANGTIGTGRVARAAPDGYTLVLGLWSTHVVNGAIYALPYDVVSDFEPVSLITDGPQVIVARKSMPANDLKELIAWLKANSANATQGNAGVGSPGQIASVFLQKQIDTRIHSVPYRGAAAAMQDLIAGQIDVMIASLIVTLQPVRAGHIKAYAVTAKNRLTAAPEIPTVDEAGLPGFYTSPWSALWAPRATPRELIGKLNAAVVEALADPAIRTRLADAGQEIFPREQQTPEALSAFQKAEIAKWWPIIKAANIKPE